MEEEVENVEYLDDCCLDDSSQRTEYLTPQQDNIMGDNVSCEEAFYPNAVQCLIALYSDKYKHFNSSENSCGMHGIWHDISRDMRESLFHFDANQVRQKFKQLRWQYFQVACKSDAENFEYFRSLHEIYRDKRIASYLSNDQPIRTTTHDSHKSGQQRDYPDNLLFGPPRHRKKTSVEEIAVMQKQIEEIGHKEQELMSIMKREQAFDDDIRRLNKEDAVAELLDLKQEREDEMPPAHVSGKRIKIDKPTILHVTTAKKQSPLDFRATSPQVEMLCNNKSDMTIADYNEAQQRRHEEQMNVLRQTVLLQERTVELQNKLLERIIERVM